MAKKIVVVNAGPRKGWNTDALISEAAKGAESKGAEIERYDLFKLEKYTGCISCLGCKKEKFKGHCICKDALSPILEAIREADGLIIGSPIYFGETTASFRALYERLLFPNLTYNKENPCCNENPTKALLIADCNAPAGMYQELINNYQGAMNMFVGPTEAYLVADTMAIKDYDATDWPWSMFDAAHKKEQHDKVFPEQCKAAFEKGARLAE